MSLRTGIRSTFPYAIAIVGGFLLAYLIVAFFVFPAGLVPREAKVPNVTGLLLDEANKQLAEVGFHGAVSESRFHAAAPKGTVLEQAPAAGKRDEEGATVGLVVSAGQKFVSVPSVVGMQQQDAQAALEAAGLDVGPVSEQVSAEPAGQVVASSPKEGTNTPIPTSVRLIVSSGMHVVIVPDLVGHTVQEAREILNHVGLSLGDVSSTLTVDTDSAKVTSQQPTAGSQVGMGARVSVQVSGVELTSLDIP